jgi:hypothetical protein
VEDPQFQLPDYTRYRLRYVAQHQVVAEGRTFTLRFVLKTTQHDWPHYHLEEESNLNHIGPKQRRVVSPVRTALQRAIWAAMRAAGWSIDTMVYLAQPPLSHTAQALTQIHDGEWS